MNIFCSLQELFQKKGLHYLIDAFKDIATDKKLVRIAGGSSHSHDYMDQITTMSQEDSRIVMTGFVEQERYRKNCIPIHISSYCQAM